MPGRVRKHNLLTFSSFCVASEFHIKQFCTSENIIGFMFLKVLSLFIFKLCSFEKEIKPGNFHQETNDEGSEKPQPFTIRGIRHSNSNQNTEIAQSDYNVFNDARNQTGYMQ